MASFVDLDTKCITGDLKRAIVLFPEILFIEKRKRLSQQQEFVPPTSKWKSLLKQLWKNLAGFPNNITRSVQSLPHGASARKSLFLPQEGAGVLFP